MRFIRWLNIGRWRTICRSSAEIGRELTRHVVPDDIGSGVENASGLLVGMIGPEIGERTGLRTCFRPADVDHPSPRVEHAVDPRPILRQATGPVP